MSTSLSPAEAAAAEAYVAQTGEELVRYVDPAHHTYLDLYLERADALHALGRPPAEVLAELQRAGRCYALHGRLFLERWPAYKLKSRRLVPLELALIAGGDELLAAAGDLSLPVMSALAQVEASSLTRELDALMGGGIHDAPRDVAGVAGLFGVVYWGALSALLEGDTAALGAILVRGRAARAEAASIVSGGPAALGRLDALVRALTALAPADLAVAAEALIAHAGHVADARAEPDAEAPWRGSLDRTSLAVVAAAAALGADLGPALQSAAGEPYIAALLPYAVLLAA